MNEVKLNVMKTSVRRALLMWFWLLLSAPIVLIAQSDVNVISGTLRDARTRARIGNAAISVPGSAVGTVSNSEGEFSLKIPKSSGADTFVVSHISYETKILPLSNYTNLRKDILLDAKVQQLSEVVVNPADPRAVVKLAFEKIKNNYSHSPNLMKAFYRESIRQRRNYISITEAVVDISKAPYLGLKTDEVKILKGRKGVNVKRADTVNVMLQGGPKVLLYVDVPKNPALGIALVNWENYDFKYDNVAWIDDKPNYVIHFRPARVLEDPLYFGRVFIQQNNFAITRVEFNLDLRDEEKASAMFVTKKPRDMVFAPTETNYLVTFKPQGDKYYLNYIRFDVKFKSDWKRKLFKNNYTIISEMAITDREETDDTKIPNSERFKPNMIMSETVGAFYDEEFWGSHNIIEPEEAIENAIRRITKKMN